MNSPTFKKKKINLSYSQIPCHERKRKAETIEKVGEKKRKKR